MCCGFHLARSCACADDWRSDGNLRLTAVNRRLFNQVDNTLYLWSYSSTALLCFLTKTVWARTNLWYRHIFINENYFASIGWIVNSFTSEVKKHSCILTKSILIISFPQGSKIKLKITFNNYYSEASDYLFLHHFALLYEDNLPVGKCGDLVAIMSKFVIFEFRCTTYWIVVVKRVCYRLILKNHVAKV